MELESQTVDKTPTTKNLLETLPPELILEISKYLMPTMRNLMNFRNSSRSLRSIVTSNQYPYFLKYKRAVIKGFPSKLRGEISYDRGVDYQLLTRFIRR